MKKLIILIAIALLAWNGYSQNGTLAKSGMVLLVNEARKQYTKGMSYENWLAESFGSATPTKPESTFLKEMYGFVSGTKNPEMIYKEYSGASLVALAESRANLSVLDESHARCGFWCQLLFAFTQWYYRDFINLYNP